MPVYCTISRDRAVRQKALVDLAVAGNRFAATDLFHEFEKMAYAVSRIAADRFSLRGGEADVNEVAGAALAHLMNNLRKYLPEVSRVSTWAYTTLVRAANREAGKQATARRRERGSFDAGNVAADEDLPEDWDEDDVDEDWYERAAGVLNGRELEVIRRRFGLCGAEPEGMTAIGASLGITRQRVCQLAKAALRKMAAALYTQAARVGA